MRNGVGRWRVAVCVCAGALCGLLGAAQAHADGPVLHEHIPDLSPEEAVLELSRGRPDPVAIESEGQVLLAPDLDAPALDSPPLTAEQGDGLLGAAPGQRSSTFTPDRITELEGQLDYYATFKPVIAPFKRVTALDATVLAPGSTVPVLAIASQRLRAVPIEGADVKPPDARPRDLFWGEAALDFSRGRMVPLPSVAPESRLLSLRTTGSRTTASLSVARDGADNFFIALGSNEPLPADPVRIAYLMDAPTTYFGGDIPSARLDALAAEVPGMDPSLRRKALSLAREIGVADGADLPSALNALVAHFRAFEESSEPPRNTGDVYADLVRGKKGVCRHRAYGFVVTAHALGIPTRFVQNEAHSFVEVKLPGVGYRRIDLGGAAQGLRAHGASDAPLYQPKEPESLPRPAAYEESYSQLGLGATGVRKPADHQLAGRWLSPADDDPSAARSAGAPVGRGAGSARRASQSSGPPSRPPREPLRIELLELSENVLRGERLAVAGRVLRARLLASDPEGKSGDGGVEGLRVEVSFAAADRRERLLLGVMVTGAGGVFHGELGVPSDLPVGDYRLVVLTPGDDRHEPAVAQ